MRDFYILMFSCGKDSTALLFKILEHGLPLDKILYISLDWEDPKTSDLLYDIELRIQPLKIDKLFIDYTYWLGNHIKTRGKNKGKKGYGWPDFRNRWCASLKRDIAKRELKKYYKKYNVIEYHGIAYNEQNRLCKNNDSRNILYPLVDLKMTEKDNLQYCYDLGIRFNNNYDNKKRLSCWCCPMQSIQDLRYMYNKRPDLWTKLQKLDKLSYRRFKPEYTLQQLADKFAKENENLK